MLVYECPRESAIYSNGGLAGYSIFLKEGGRGGWGERGRERERGGGEMINLECF